MTNAPSTTAQDTALREAEAAVIASRGAPGAWLALAHVHWSAGRPQGALAACDAGLAARPNTPDLLCAKGAFLTDLDRTAEARGVFEVALASAPGAPGALFGLARIAADAGDWDEADALWRALSQAQAPAPEHQWLAGRIALGRRRYADARSALERLLAADGLSPMARAEANLLLSEALEGLDEPAGAFAAASRGKGLQRQAFEGVARGREPVAGRYTRLRRAFSGADPDTWGPAPAGTATSPARSHVFLVGFPRSGTTLLEQALAGSRDVCTLEEAPTLGGAHDAFLSSDDGVRRLARLTVQDADIWRERYWATVRTHAAEPDGRIFLDKAPAATDDLPLIAKLFPGARVVFAIRDPRDVVLSCLRQNFRMNALTYAFCDLAGTAAAYTGCMALADAYRGVLPLEILDVRHEDLVADFEPQLRRICSFVGLTFDAAMLDVAATASGREVRTPSAPQVRAGLNAQGIGRWRRYARELAPVLPTLAPWVERFGYPAE